MSKRHSGDSDDAFIARILYLTKWAKNNQQAMTVAGALVAILIAGGLYYRNYQSQLRDQAAEQLETIHQSIAIERGLASSAIGSLSVRTPSSVDAVIESSSTSTLSWSLSE